MDASVYLDRTDLKNAVLALLIPPSGPEPHPTVFATGTEINGEAANPASLSRVHRHLDERAENAHLDDMDADDLQDELAELFGAGEGVLIEKADPDADRETAHQLITALAAAYPLPLAVRDSLPLAP
ncbi:hypothetical protein OG883_43625 [Streptomyces sp. NBC_01142]|uniref:hypothetical protein n=1 Tax=Streptomyces sp. NBC_01142 TaxID=2975865 RepID=UPI00224E6251|nr:hypothetical protein [Streptomyces sp. NBC_01142]MCX4826531.1 hypothetical protein [Streptomyces sp. NBC_01142]